MTLSESAPFLEIYTNMLPEHQAEYEQALEKIKSIIASPVATGINNKYLGEKIEQAFEHDHGFYTEWIDDAHLALGDIVRQASKDKAAIYTVDIITSDPDTSALRAYSKKDYLKRTSLINPLAHYELLKNGYTEEKIRNAPVAKIKKLRARD
ncbi:MAG: hypothetical protein NT124_02135 [Candidatus Dependentiae bacterium]|nr:hypothetical protein [Candidatus Dependentiae bacterium]